MVVQRETEGRVAVAMAFVVVVPSSHMRAWVGAVVVVISVDVVGNF